MFVTKIFIDFQTMFHPFVPILYPSLLTYIVNGRERTIFGNVNL